MKKLLFSTALIAVLFPLLVYSSDCTQKPVAVTPPTEAETMEVINFLNMKGLDKDDECKGHYAIDKENHNFCEALKDTPNKCSKALEIQAKAGEKYDKRWNIVCDADAPGVVYALFKGRVDNTEEEKYILATEQGSGHFDALEAIFSKENGNIKLLAPLNEEEGVLPGAPELSGEAAGMPGHLAYPFLTTACGITYMNFIDSDWTIDNIQSKKPVVYVWKDGTFNKVKYK